MGGGVLLDIGAFALIGNGINMAVNWPDRDAYDSYSDYSTVEDQHIQLMAASFAGGLVMLLVSSGVGIAGIVMTVIGFVRRSQLLQQSEVALCLGPNTAYLRWRF